MSDGYPENESETRDQSDKQFDPSQLNLWGTRASADFARIQADQLRQIRSEDAPLVAKASPQTGHGQTRPTTFDVVVKFPPKPGENANQNLRFNTPAVHGGEQPAPEPKNVQGREGRIDNEPINFDKYWPDTEEQEPKPLDRVVDIWDGLRDRVSEMRQNHSNSRTNSHNNVGDDMTETQPQTRPGNELAVVAQQAFPTASDLAKDGHLNPRIDPSSILVSSWKKPIKHVKDVSVLRRQGVDYDAYLEDFTEAVAEEQFSTQPHIDSVAQQNIVGNEARRIVKESLPRAIGDSDAFYYVGNDVATQAGAHYVVHEKETMAAVAAEQKLLPNTLRRQQQQAIDALGEKSVRHGLGEVLPEMPDAPQRVAAALSRSDSLAASVPIEVVTNSQTNVTVVDAWHIANVIQAETYPGGLVLGRGEAIANVVRPNGVEHKTFRASVGAVQDLQDPSITLLYAVEPGSIPMPGGFPELTPLQSAFEGVQIDNPDHRPKNWGNLVLTAVGVKASRFDRRMFAALDAPQVRERKPEPRDDGIDVIVEERSRINLPSALAFLNEQRDIGKVHPIVHRAQSDRPSISSGNAHSDENVYEAEIVDDDRLGETR